MARLSESRTSVTLLGRVCQNPTDQAAWAEFVSTYGGKIHAWCRGYGLQHADAGDVTQQVLLKLAKRLAKFQYDPCKSFRAWLRTLTHHAWQDFLTSRNRPGRGSGDPDGFALLEQIEARDELTQRLEEEYERELLREASARVKLRVTPQTWEAFQLLTVEALSGPEAAKKLGISVAAVHMAKKRVQQKLKEQIAELDSDVDGM